MADLQFCHRCPLQQAKDTGPPRGHHVPLSSGRSFIRSAPGTRIQVRTLGRLLYPSGLPVHHAHRLLMGIRKHRRPYQENHDYGYALPRTYSR